MQKILAGKLAAERAAELVAGSKLADVAFRKQLADGGTAAIDASRDPMIELARLVDGPSRKVRRILRRTGRRAAASGVRQDRPGAVRDLRRQRLSRRDVHAPAGLRQGGRLQEAGAKLPPWTTIGGAFEHSAAHGGKDPFDLPESWLKHKKDLDLQHAVQLRQHGRHHRRQLGQPGDQPRGRSRRA